MKGYKLISFLLILIYSNAYSQLCTNKIVAGYMPDYRDPTTVDFSKLTHAYFCFIEATANGGIAPQQNYSVTRLNTMVSLCNAAGTSKLICVGSGGSIATMAASSTARKLFADTLRKYCQFYDLNGVDMDWEAINNATDRSNFELMMGVLHDTLSKYSLKLVATVGFGDYWLQWYTNQAIQYADWMQIMVYDQTATWPGSPFGNHASFAHVQQAEAYWVGRGFNRNFMAIGLPFYGYKFASIAGGSGTAYTYSNIVASFPTMDSCANQTPCTDYNFFNGPNLIRKKVNYAITQGFKGVFIWELGQDAAGTNSLLSKVHNEFSKACAGATYNETCTSELSGCPTPIYENETQSFWIHYEKQEELLSIGNLPIENGELLIYDLAGKLICQEQLKLNNKEIISIPLVLKEGIFFTTIKNKETVFCKKIVAQ